MLCVGFTIGAGRPAYDSVSNLFTAQIDFQQDIECLFFGRGWDNEPPVYMRDPELPDESLQIAPSFHFKGRCRIRDAPARRRLVVEENVLPVRIRAVGIHEARATLGFGLSTNTSGSDIVRFDLRRAILTPYAILAQLDGCSPAASGSHR